MSKQNEMMAQALKEYMQMRADDIAEVYEIMSIEDVKTRNAREDKYIEDTLNDVFARNMPELQEEDMEVDETIYHPSAEPKPFVKPRTIEEVNKLKGETKRKKKSILVLMDKLHPRTQEYIKWVFKYGVGILIPNDSPEMKRNCIETALRFEQSTGKTYAPSEPWINELNRAIDAQYGSIAERKRKFKLNKPKGETNE